MTVFGMLALSTSVVALCTGCWVGVDMVCDWVERAR